MRYSHQRELVRKTVKERFDHPTADMIYESVREIEPTISLGTVYRNLKQLSEESAIFTLETMDKKLHYDGRTEPHIHFICNKCNCIFDFLIPTFIPNEILDKGFSVTAAKCVYYGVCDTCEN